MTTLNHAKLLLGSTGLALALMAAPMSVESIASGEFTASALAQSKGNAGGAERPVAAMAAVTRAAAAARKAFIPAVSPMVRAAPFPVP